MTDIDLTNLTLSQVFALLAEVALFDVAAAIALSIMQGRFSLGAVAVWLQSHVLLRVFPIFALAVIGHGIEPFAPAIPFAFGLAIAGLAAYVLETVASIRKNFGDATRPMDDTADTP